MAKEQLVKHTDEKRSTKQLTIDFLHELVVHFPHDTMEVDLSVKHEEIGNPTSNIAFTITAQKKDGGENAVTESVERLSKFFKKNNITPEANGNQIKLTLEPTTETVRKLKYMRLSSFQDKNSWEYFVEQDRKDQEAKKRKPEAKGFDYF